VSELIAHLVGDYILQNHWMAVNKTSRWPLAFVHVLLYGLPFLVLGASWPALAVIVGTHLLIDRFRLAKYWVAFWGIGTMGWVLTQAYHARGYAWVTTPSGDRPLLPPSWLTIPELTDEWVRAHRVDFPDAPPFLGVWLLILVDNTMHLGINHWALAHL
jgi:hypothetical protein